MKHDKKQRRHLQTDINAAPTPGPPDFFKAFLLVWSSGIVLAFFHGHHLGNRLPRLAHLINFIDLLTFSGRIFAGGLAWNLFLVSVVWFIFWSIGNALIRSFDLEDATSAERALVSSGLGAGIVSLALLGLGLLGFWNPDLIRYGFMGSAALSVGTWTCDRMRNHANRSPTKPTHTDITSQPNFRALDYAALVLIACAFALTLLASAAPETFFDSLVYHLALPKLYLLRGSIEPTPYNLYSGFPFGIEMLYGLALSISDEHLAILLHGTFGWVATATLYTWLRRYSTRSTAILAVTLFFLSPIVLAATWQSGVELGTAFYLSIALITTSLSLHSSNANQSRRWAIVSGALIGFLLGTKYTALPLGAGLIIVYAYLRKRNGEPISDAAWMGFTAVLTFTPWVAKNLLFYGNPIYPFFHTHFGSTTPANWKMFLEDAHSRDVVATFRTATGWKELLLLPWRITVDQFFNYRISLAYLMLTPWCFPLYRNIFRKEAPAHSPVKLAASIALIGLFAWSMTSTVTRFLLPTLLICGIISASSFNESRVPNWMRNIILILITGISTCNLIGAYLDGGPGLSGKWAVLTGQRSRNGYLTTPHAGYGQPYYAAMEYINENLPANARVLFLGESRSYYCERDFIAATTFDNNPFWIAARDANTAEELHRKLRELGITHIFLNVFQLYSNADFPAVLPRDTASQESFIDFWNRYLQKTFEKRGDDSAGRINEWLLVYELRDSPIINKAESTNNPISDVLLQLKQQGR